MKFIQLTLIALLLFTGYNCNAQKKRSLQPIKKEVKTLIVYGSDDCHHCIDTKKFLDENKIKYQFFDIDKNPQALQEMLSKLKANSISLNNLMIPVIDKQGNVFTNSENFEDFLKKLKNE